MQHNSVNFTPAEGRSVRQAPEQSTLRAITDDPKELKNQNISLLQEVQEQNFLIE
jgi:hypothetical protein